MFICGVYSQRKRIRASHFIDHKENGILLGIFLFNSVFHEIYKILIFQNFLAENVAKIIYRYYISLILKNEMENKKKIKNQHLEKIIH